LGSLPAFLGVGGFRAVCFENRAMAAKILIGTGDGKWEGREKTREKLM
jgi:hypothetical protein